MEHIAIFRLTGYERQDALSLLFFFGNDSPGSSRGRFPRARSAIGCRLMSASSDHHIENMNTPNCSFTRSFDFHNARYESPSSGCRQQHEGFLSIKTEASKAWRCRSFIHFCNATARQDTSIDPTVSLSSYVHSDQCPSAFNFSVYLGFGQTGQEIILQDVRYQGF